MSRASFNRLKNKVARSYEKKGYSPARAQKIGRATAGKVANEKRGKR